MTTTTERTEWKTQYPDIRNLIEGYPKLVEDIARLEAQVGDAMVALHAEETKRDSLQIALDSAKGAVLHLIHEVKHLTQQLDEAKAKRREVEELKNLLQGLSSPHEEAAVEVGQNPLHQDQAAILGLGPDEMKQLPKGQTASLLGCLVLQILGTEPLALLEITERFNARYGESYGPWLKNVPDMIRHFCASRPMLVRKEKRGHYTATAFGLKIGWKWANTTKSHTPSSQREALPEKPTTDKVRGDFKGLVYRELKADPNQDRNALFLRIGLPFIVDTSDHGLVIALPSYKDANGDYFVNVNGWGVQRDVNDHLRIDAPNSNTRMEGLDVFIHLIRLVPGTKLQVVYKPKNDHKDTLAHFKVQADALQPINLLQYNALSKTRN